MAKYAEGFVRGREDARRGCEAYYTVQTRVHADYVRGYMAGFEDEVWFSEFLARV